MKSLKNLESKRDGLLFLPSTDLCGSPTPTCRTHGRVSKVVADQDDLTQSRYRHSSIYAVNVGTHKKQGKRKPRKSRLLKGRKIG